MDVDGSMPNESESARQFWKLWQKVPPPDLAPFVQQAGALTPARLAAVLCVDLRERWRRQERIPPEDYLKKFPQVLTDRDAAIDVVYCEFLLRDELGEEPTTAEYAARFPDLASELTRQIEMHRLLEEESDSAATVKTNIPISPGKSRTPSQSSNRSLPTIPGFQILGRLGRGGMGVVYKAWQEKLFRVVALKMVKTDLKDAAQALARFRVETEAIARLQHPNILQVHEVGEYEGRPFLVMEFADAGTLADKLDGTPWSAHDAAKLVETLARAIHYAHQRGVLHRDLTPGNILLFGDGTAKLSDFGLAKLLGSGGGTLTQTGAIVGTPNYMSPEQARGTLREAGPTADVYGLGAILFELITGRPPFSAATPLETLALVAHTEAISPRQLQPTLPRDLETICVKCLRKEPGRRYASAAELADDLHRFLKGEPIRARPVGQVERVWRWGRRNPGWASALVMLALTAVGAVLAAYFLERALEESERAKHQTLRRLYRSTVNEARAKRLSGRVGQRYLSLGLLEDARKLAIQLNLPADRFQDLRTEIIACLALPDLEQLREWDGLPAGTFSVDFDDTLTLVARADMRGNVSVHNVVDNVETATLPGRGEPVLPRFSPDAKLLAVSSATSLRLWKMDAGKPLDLPASPQFSFGMHGKQIAILSKDTATVTIHDTGTAAEIRRIDAGGQVAQLAFHPADERIALATDKETLIVDSRTGKIADRLPHPNRACCVAWSHDGRLLATGCDDKVLRVWEVKPASGHRLLGQIPGHGTQGLEMMLNRDGTLLAATNWADNLRVWDAHSGQQLVMPLAEAGMFRFAAADDRLAASAPGGKLRLYRTIRGQEFRRLPSYNRYRQSGARMVVFHPAGRLLIGAAEDGLASLDTWKIESRALPLVDKATIPICFDPRGALITESAAGYQSWPLRMDPARPETAHLGPPRFLAARGQGLRAACDARGRILAIPELDDGARVVFLEEPVKNAGPGSPAYKEIRLGPQKNVHFCAVSPDGQWIVTGTQDAPGQPGAVVWEAATGKRIHDVAAMPRKCEIGFSPNGRWLITSAGNCQLWEVGTWKPGPVLGGSAFAFSPDGKLLAVEGMEGQVRLVHPDRGSEYAILTAPGELHSLPVCFNADGSSLAVYGTETQTLHTWDLRSVRQHLQELDLDWDLPPYPPALVGPSQVELVAR